MEKKRCKVVMLPTGFRNSDIQLGLEGGYIYYKTNCIDERTRYQHLYITDDSEIKEGDYAYCTRVEQIYRVGKFDS
jgi:septum formation inhibitor-activating ATPase MinD